MKRLNVKNRNNGCILSGKPWTSMVYMHIASSWTSCLKSIVKDTQVVESDDVVMQSRSEMNESADHKNISTSQHC